MYIYHIYHISYTRPRTRSGILTVAASTRFPSSTKRPEVNSRLLKTSICTERFLKRSDCDETYVSFGKPYCIVRVWRYSCGVGGEGSGGGGGGGRCNRIPRDNKDTTDQP